MLKNNFFKTLFQFSKNSLFLSVPFGIWKTPNNIRAKKFLLKGVEGMDLAIDVHQPQGSLMEVCAPPQSTFISMRGQGTPQSRSFQWKSCQSAFALNFGDADEPLWPGLGWWRTGVDGMRGGRCSSRGWLIEWFMKFWRQKNPKRLHLLMPRVSTGEFWWTTASSPPAWWTVLLMKLRWHAVDTRLWKVRKNHDKNLENLIQII